MLCCDLPRREENGDCVARLFYTRHPVEPGKRVYLVFEEHTGWHGSSTLVHACEGGPHPDFPEDSGSHIISAGDLEKLHGTVPGTFLTKEAVAPLIEILNKRPGSAGIVLSKDYGKYRRP